MRKLVWMVVLLGSALALADPTAERAIRSRLAARSLLLDVERAGDRLVAVGEWGHVVLSDDGGVSWRQADSVPTQVTLTGASFVDAREGWAVGHDAVVLHTGDGGLTWELQYAAPADEAPLLDVWFANARHGIAVGAFGLVLRTQDGGRTWEQQTFGEDMEEAPHLNQVFAGPDGVLFVAAEFGVIFRSLDGGDSWERLHPPYEGSFWGGLVLNGKAVLVFGMRGHVFRSDDHGSTWQAIRSGTEQSLQAATRLRDGSIVVVGLGGAVLTSKDEGRTFVASTQPDRQGIADVAEGADGRLLLFGEAGVKTRTAGAVASSE